MEEGTILQWLRAVGDDVSVGDELAEIETDKANMAYESDVAGTLTEILVQEGETVAIGTPIARVGEASEAPGTEAKPREQAVDSFPYVATAPSAVLPATPLSPSTPVPPLLRAMVTGSKLPRWRAGSPKNGSSI